MKKLGFRSVALAALGAISLFPTLAASNEISSLEMEKVKLARENATLRELVRLREENASLRKQLGQDASATFIESSPPQMATSGTLPAAQSRRQATSNLGSPGYAANLGPQPAYKAVPPVVTPVPVYSWTGLYVGGHFGIGWSHHDRATSAGSETSPETFIFEGRAFDLSDTGVVAGGQVGYNWQFAPTWVLGIEADLSGTSLRRTVSQDVAIAGLIPPDIEGQIDMSHDVRLLGSVRGRIGYGWGKYLL
jgi:opacity protein-like surface antigen